MQVKSWVIALCAGGLAGAVYSFFIPEKNFQKVLRIVLVAFFVCILLLPLKDELRFENYFTGFENNTRNEQEDDFFQQTLLNTAAEAVKKQIKTVLTRRKCTFSSIRVSMHIDENDSIIINEICIEGVPQQQRQKVHDICKKRLALEVSIK